MHRVSLLCVLSCGLLFTLQAGCNKSDSATETMATESVDHALSFGQAVGQIEQLAQSIGQSMANGDTEAAHEPLHEIGHLLDELPHLAELEGLAETDQATIQAAADQLMDAYGAIDAGMHGEAGKSYDDVKGDIATALESLDAFEHSHP